MSRKVTRAGRNGTAEDKLGLFHHLDGQIVFIVQGKMALFTHVPSWGLIKLEKL